MKNKHVLEIFLVADGNWNKFIAEFELNQYQLKQLNDFF